MPIGYDNEAPKRYNYTIFLYYLKLVEVQEPQEKISVVMEIMEVRKFFISAKIKNFCFSDNLKVKIFCTFLVKH